MFTKEKALEIWSKYNTDDALKKHAIAVGTTMRYFAKKYGGDENEWEFVGILHDIDYGQFPDEHCIKARVILESEAVGEDIIRAIQSHGYGICTDIEPISDMEKTLYAIDELTGLITACALMRPSKSFDDLEYSSVKKKYKNKKFAAGVDRAIVERGAEMLGMELETLIVETIEALKPCGKEIGLLRL